MPLFFNIILYQVYSSQFFFDNTRNLCPYFSMSICLTATISIWFYFSGDLRISILSNHSVVCRVIHFLPILTFNLWICSHKTWLEQKSFFASYRTVQRHLLNKSYIIWIYLIVSRSHGSSYSQLRQHWWSFSSQVRTGWIRIQFSRYLCFALL